MKAWKKLYKPEVLAEARELSDSVKIISNDGVEIIAEVDGFKVTTYMSYANPSYPSCNCSSGSSCKHEAAFTIHFINHPELYIKDSVNDVFELMSRDDLKDFLFDEFKLNSDLKNRFLKRFCDNSINRKYYTDKLDNIFKKGEEKDFDLHGFYNLDSMAGDLNNFISNDISNLLGIGEHDFACDLLVRISELLNDEVISTFDSWYYLIEVFMDQVHVLEFSIYLEAQRLDEIHLNHIIDYI